MRWTRLKYYLLNNKIVLRRLIKRIHYNIFASFITLTHSGPLKSEGLKVKAGNLIKSRGKESLEGKHANLFKRESAKGVGRLFNFRLNRRDIFVGKNGWESSAYLTPFLIRLRQLINVKIRRLQKSLTMKIDLKLSGWFFDLLSLSFRYVNQFLQSKVRRSCINQIKSLQSGD